MSGSVAATFSVTFRLFVKAAPPLTCTVPAGPVASIVVVCEVSTVSNAPRVQAGVWHPATVSV